MLLGKGSVNRHIRRISEINWGMSSKPLFLPKLRRKSVARHKSDQKNTHNYHHATHRYGPIKTEQTHKQTHVWSAGRACVNSRMGNGTSSRAVRRKCFFCFILTFADEMQLTHEEFLFHNTETCQSHRKPDRRAGHGFASSTRPRGRGAA